MTLKTSATDRVLCSRREGKAYYMAFAQKESQSGMFSHERLFVLQQGEALGYISDPSHLKTERDVQFTQCKAVIPLKSIRKISLKLSILVLHFDTLSGHKEVDKKWTLIFHNASVANQMLQLLDENCGRSPLRKCRSSQLNIWQDESPKEDGLEHLTKQLKLKWKGSAEQTGQRSEDSVPQAQKRISENLMSTDDRNVGTCKGCFIEEATMINKTCEHVIICQGCFQKQAKHTESPHKKQVKCPMCKKEGQYTHVIAFSAQD